MLREHLSRIASLCLALAGLALLACSTSLKSSAPPLTILGGGSTFINPAMTRWISDFEASHPSVQITYYSVGSGGGIGLLNQGAVDFAASDAALDDQKLKDLPPLVQIPASGGSVCITYNLPQLKAPVQLSGSTLAAIYLGRIKSWHDAAVQRDNEALPCRISPSRWCIAPMGAARRISSRVIFPKPVRSGRRRLGTAPRSLGPWVQEAKGMQEWL